MQIKDLILGGEPHAIKDRDDYLKKQAESQFRSTKRTSLKKCAPCSPAISWA